MFKQSSRLEYFIIIQDHIIKHKMFAFGAVFFVEKHENTPRNARSDCKPIRKLLK